MTKNIFIVFLAIINMSLSAQTATEKKMDALISALDQTKFIQEYKEYKNDTEAKIAEIKLNTTLDTKEVAKLKIAYNQSRFKFDAILDQLKRDLSNSATQKLIVKSPSVFSNSYQKKLDEARKYCSNNFHQKADDMLKKGEGADLETIQLLINSFFTVFKAIGEKKKESEEFNAVYLEMQLIEPLRFKTWDKVE